MRETKPAPKQPSSEFYEPYSAFARTLRTWFVAFGIGVPALLITNEKAREVLRDSGCARCVAGIFLVGVAIQVATTLLYKSAMSYLYLSEDNPSMKGGCLYKCFDWISESFLLEFSADFATLLLFCWATCKLLWTLT